MKQDNFIRDAIDESLCGVRFSAQDVRSVLRAARNREEAPAGKPLPRRPLRLEFAFAVATMLILVLPIGWLALRAQGMRTTPIAAAPGTTAASTQAGLDPRADVIIATSAPDYTAQESEAIRIARACFEENCDTSVFTFEEYTVSVTPGEGGAYTVTMESIYGNGCRFTAEVSTREGRVLRHSTPQLATVPTYLDSSAPEIRAWYDKYGPHLMAWPQQTQAEFSRRYEGAALRTALPGELTAQEAADLAKAHVKEHLTTKETVYAYPLLYAERASGDGVARYAVACYLSPIEAQLPEPVATVSFTATGQDIVFVSGE